MGRKLKDFSFIKDAIFVEMKNHCEPRPSVELQK